MPKVTEVPQKSLHEAAMSSFCTFQVKEGFMARFFMRFDEPVAHDEMFLCWDENSALEMYLFYRLAQWISRYSRQRAGKGCSLPVHGGNKRSRIAPSYRVLSCGQMALTANLVVCGSVFTLLFSTPFCQPWADVAICKLPQSWPKSWQKLSLMAKKIMCLLRYLWPHSLTKTSYSVSKVNRRKGALSYFLF